MKSSHDAPTTDLMARYSGASSSAQPLPSSLQRWRLLPPLWYATHVPKAGLWWLVLGLLLLTVSLIKTINLLVLLACLLLTLWFINFLLSGQNLRWLQGQRWIPWPIFARTPFTVEKQLVNLRSGLLIGLQIKDRGLHHRCVRSIPQLAGRQTLRWREEMTLPARGRYLWDALQAVSGYPFGLVESRMRLTPSNEIIVLPQLGRVHCGRLRRFLTCISASPNPTQQRPLRHPTAQGEFHGLRSFRSGDSPRWIHWRTSARRGELMVREFEDRAADNLILIVNLMRGPELSSQGQVAAAARSSAEFVRMGREPLSSDFDLEEVICLAATICWEWCRQKGERLILAIAGPAPIVFDGNTGMEYALRLLECLAVQTAVDVGDSESLLNRLGSLALPRAPILVLERQASHLPEIVAKRLNRPVANLDSSHLTAVDFYERPGHAH